MRNIRFTVPCPADSGAPLGPVVRGALLPAQTQEDDAAALLRQADGYYKKGDYKLAIGTYLEAAALSRSRLNLSAAYFGLALCYFYERDMANSVKWMRQTAQIDPGKEISDSFYPKSFVDLYRSVSAEVRAKGLPAEEIAAAAQPERQAEEPPPAQAAPVRRAEPEPTIETKTSNGRGDAGRGEALEPGWTLFSSGHWEVNVHGGHLDDRPDHEPVRGPAYRRAERRASEPDRQGAWAHPTAAWSRPLYTPSLELDSQGGNYGLEIRYFARGWAGTFSFGVSAGEDPDQAGS